MTPPHREPPDPPATDPPAEGPIPLDLARTLVACGAEIDRLAHTVARLEDTLTASLAATLPTNGAAPPGAALLRDLQVLDLLRQSLAELARILPGLAVTQGPADRATVLATLHLGDLRARLGPPAPASPPTPAVQLFPPRPD